MKTNRRKNNKGQVTVEAVLMVVIVVVVVSLVGDFFKSNEVFKKLVYSPWQSMSGMLQNGTWGPPADTNFAHPNQGDQNRTNEGDK